VASNGEGEQEDKWVVKEGARQAESAGDSTRSCGLGRKYDEDVRRREAAHAGDLNLRWGLHLECYEAQVENAVGSTRRCDLNRK
jgi:creatinine amidohydrolase/Fe(II)-dependent formamide hydrolase-like protein